MDFEGLQKTLTARCGWRPSEFWGAWLYDCQLAVEGVVDQDRNRLRAEAANAAWIINNVRGAVWGKSFSPVKPGDLFSPDGSKLTKEEAEQYRESLQDRIDPVKPPGYFSSGPQQGNSQKRKPGQGKPQQGKPQQGKRPPPPKQRPK